jgi:hypothetical protein
MSFTFASAKTVQPNQFCATLNIGTHRPNIAGCTDQSRRRPGIAETAATSIDQPEMPSPCERESNNLSLIDQRRSNDKGRASAIRGVPDDPS